MPGIDVYMGAATDFAVMVCVVLATVIIVLMLSAAWGTSFATREASSLALAPAQTSVH